MRIVCVVVVAAGVRPMWTQRVAVAVGGMRVDANLRMVQVRARRTSLVQRPVPGRVVAVQGQHLQQSSSSSVVL
ncbi:hypothetical protein Taro_028253 [Colocasia esculenta]|uniref:Uncharacterized protein n=1 Tax=Colocasia esculenta TaxID=4460 RepID=A0A843VAS0_COLES|nr:hypothetical protein [Colocasia esculenta]